MAEKEQARNKKINFVVIVTPKRSHFKITRGFFGKRYQFGLSGAPWKLIKTFGLTAEHIAKRTKALSEKKYK